jgi:hypothetical protein
MFSKEVKTRKAQEEGCTVVKQELAEEGKSMVEE